MVLTDYELEQLLTDLETDRVERKESAADGAKIREAICAFANDMPGHALPGVVFIGVKMEAPSNNGRRDLEPPLARWHAPPATQFRLTVPSCAARVSCGGGFLACWDSASAEKNCFQSRRF